MSSSAFILSFIFNRSKHIMLFCIIKVAIGMMSMEVTVINLAPSIAKPAHVIYRMDIALNVNLGGQKQRAIQVYLDKTINKVHIIIRAHILKGIINLYSFYNRMCFWIIWRRL